MIELKNISKSFGDKLVLDDITLSIPEKSVIGLVGPNGSGKSTLLRILSGVYNADNGDVFFEKEAIFENPEVKQNIAFLGDEPYFFNQATLKDMHDFYKLFYPKFSEKTYQRLTELFKLNPDVKLTQFSKGMKRQVSLILAISCSPRLLLLDEAFDGLDPIMRFKLRQVMSELISDTEMTIIISSHNLRELEDICDAVIMIHEHKLQLNQSLAEASETYHKFNVAFSSPIDKNLFDFLNPLHISGDKQIFTLYLRGNKEELKTKINQLNPLLVETAPVSLEEIFIYEVGGDI